MPSKCEATELRQIFAIKVDLARAARFANQDDIDFHLNELAVMQMHTTSERLRQACKETIAGPKAQRRAAVNA